MLGVNAVVGAKSSQESQTPLSILMLGILRRICYPFCYVAMKLSVDSYVLESASTGNTADETVYLNH